MIDQYNIQLDDLPPDFRNIAETIGLEPTLKLVEARGGDGLYVPTVATVCRADRDRAIRAEFNGASHRDLARKYDLTVVRIRTIVGQAAGSSKNRTSGVDIIDKQMTLF